MSRFKLRRVPLRLTTGAFVLSAGVDKWKGDEATAGQIHGFATGTYPFLKGIKPKKFLRLLAGSEIVIGSALLIPVVPAAVAGLGLTGFAVGLLGLYVRTPGMRRGAIDPRATQQGTAISKDLWMLGIGLGLIADGLTDKD